ncbi:MAG: hypothetical protein FJ100_22960 [Deltaproteobacteria bacterium]|nr:hypothetical protein [Deltaproteobacteria bacterium]
MSGDRPLAVWIHGTLEQSSVWSIGGSAGPRAADMAFCRDGGGALTLTGAALAGAIVDAAAKVAPGWANEARRGVGPMTALTSKFRETRSGQLHASALQTFHTHPVEAAPFLRPGVALLHKTRAATGESGTGALFDAEVTAAGTRWPLALRLDGLSGHAEDLEWLLARVLADWAAGLGWLGAGVARGMGWFALKDARVVRVSRSPAGLEIDAALWVAGPAGVPLSSTVPIDFDLWQKSHPQTAAAPGSPWWRAAFVIDIAAGPRADGWGADFVAVGGHDSADAGDGHDVSQVRHVARMGRTNDQTPYLPGSAIRGTLRHAAAALARGAGAGNVLDPAIDTDAAGAGQNDPGNAARSPVDDWFGTVNLSSRIAVRDGLQVGDSPETVDLELHAEDEFTAATYQGAKYTVEAVVQGTFRTLIAVEASDRAQLDAGVHQLLPALRLAEIGHVSLGGDAFSGLGWPSWTVRGVHVGRFGDGQAARATGKGGVVAQWAQAGASAASDPAEAAQVVWRYMPAKVAASAERGHGTAAAQANTGNLAEGDRQLRVWSGAGVAELPVGDLVRFIAETLTVAGEPWILTAEFAQGPHTVPGLARWWQPGENLPDHAMTEAILHLCDGWVRVAATARGLRAACARYGANGAPACNWVAWAEIAPIKVRLAGQTALTRGDWSRFGLERPESMPEAVAIVAVRATDGDQALAGWHFVPAAVGGG